MAISTAIGTLSTERSDPTSPTFDGVFNALDFGVIRGTNGVTPLPSDAGFQAWFDAMEAYANDNKCGVRGVVPAGMYKIGGSVMMPGDLPFGEMAISAFGAIILHDPQADDVVMFDTRQMVDQSDALDTANNREMWTWAGGMLTGTNRAGQTGFHLRSVHRMTIDNVSFTTMSSAVRGEFCLQFRAENCRLVNCGTYGFWLSHGSWPGATETNSAGNAVTIVNCRFFSRAGALANVKTENIGVTIDDCTFEGHNPVANIDFYSRNTSVLSSSFTNLHVENSPTSAHIVVDTLHGVEIDFQHAVDPPFVDCVTASNVIIHRLPWATTTEATNALTPSLVSRMTGDSFPRWSFMSSGQALTFDPTNSTLWDEVNGRVPGSISTIGSFRGVPATTPHRPWRSDLLPVTGLRHTGEAFDRLFNRLVELGLIDDQTTGLFGGVSGTFTGTGVAGQGHRMEHRLGFAPNITVTNLTTGEVHGPGGPSLVVVDAVATNAVFSTATTDDYEWRAV